MRILRILAGLLIVAVLSLMALFTYQYVNQANETSATAIAGRATAEAERDVARTQEAELRLQQAAAAAAPTFTPVLVPVPGPTQFVPQPSASYSYTGTVTISDSPSVTRIRYSVVLPPEVKGNVSGLRFRLQGGQDVEFKSSGQETMIDIQPGYYTAYIVPASDSGTSAPIGSTGQFLVSDGQTAAVVFTFVGKERP
jgi:type II secretory pathway pseudopilin PulG